MRRYYSINTNLRVLKFGDGQNIAFTTDANSIYKVSDGWLERLIGVAEQCENDADRAGGSYAEKDEAYIKRLEQIGFLKTPHISAKPGTDLARFNWLSATDYLAITYNYGFLNYELNGSETDNQRMADYRSKEEEVERSKVYEYASVKVTGLDPKGAAKRLRETTNTSIFQAVHDALSIAIGTTKTRRLNNSDVVLRKTVPSGGSRHPTEAYLFNIKTGEIFHFNCRTYELCLISTYEPSSLIKIFYTDCSYLDYTPVFYTVFTCVWERNMFRYREPRTFRSVHLDCGHVSMQLETALLKSGCRVQAQYNFDSLALEKILNIDPLDEGVMSSVAIGDR